LDIKVVTNMADFAGLREEWNDLLSRSATKHIFLTHEWQYTWWKHFGTGDENLLILLVRDGDDLVGIAPLRRDRLRLKGLPVFRTISFLLGYEADYRDFLLQQGTEWDVLGNLISYLKGQVGSWHILSLIGLHGASRSNEIIPVLSRQQGLFYHGEVGVPCPFIPLPKSYDSFLARMSGSTRREYQRKLRKMEREKGEVHVEIHRGNQATSADIDEFLRLHHSSWQSRGGSQAIVSERMEAFHHDLIENMEGVEWPLISRIVIGGNPCSIIYGYVIDDVFYDYLPGFEPSLSRYSLGAQAIMQTVEFGIAEGWREFDLMRGEERYKFHFTDRVRHSINHFASKSPLVLKMLGVLEALAR